MSCLLYTSGKKDRTRSGADGGAADLHDHGHLYDPDVFRDHNCVVSNVK